MTQDTAVFREHLEYLQDQGHQLSGDPALIAAAMGGMLSMLAYARPAYSDPAILDALTGLLLYGLTGPAT